MTRGISNAAFIQSNPACKDLKTSDAIPLSAEGIKTAPAPEARDAYNQCISDDIADIAGFATGYVIGEITNNVEKGEIEKTAEKNGRAQRKNKAATIKDG